MEPSSEKVIETDEDKIKTQFASINQSFNDTLDRWNPSSLNSNGTVQPEMTEMLPQILDNGRATNSNIKPSQQNVKMSIREEKVDLENGVRNDQSDQLPDDLPDSNKFCGECSDREKPIYKSNWCKQCYNRLTARRRTEFFRKQEEELVAKCNESAKKLRRCSRIISFAEAENAVQPDNLNNDSMSESEDSQPDAEFEWSEVEQEDELLLEDEDEIDFGNFNHTQFKAREELLISKAKILLRFHQDKPDFNEKAKWLLDSLSKIRSVQEFQFSERNGQRICTSCERVKKFHSINLCEGCYSKQRYWKQKLDTERYRKCIKCKKIGAIRTSGKCL